jgi:class 3 adenylate cyclase
MRTSLYELYDGSSGQWALAARYQPRDEADARRQAETNWSQNRAPTILTQESAEDDSNDIDVSVLFRSPGSFAGIQTPTTDGGVSGRITVAIVNGVLIGVVGGVVAGIATRSAALGALGTLLLGAVASLGMFRLMIPDELMMWRNKTAVAKAKTIAAIQAAAQEDAPNQPSGPLPSGPMTLRRRRGAFSHPVGEPVVVAPKVARDIDESVDDAAEPSMAQAAADLLQELISKQVSILNAFLAEGIAALGPQARQLQAFDRYGIHLYLAGAAQEIAAREALTDSTVQSILIGVLVDQGQTADSVRSFCERLDGAQQRPRFKAMLDAGRAAMAMVLNEQAIPSDAALPVVLRTWSNPHDKAVASRKYGVLLTDLIGSTDLTRKLGNSGAQRMLRAHNAIIREALKQRRGTEVKHTGDGILAIFERAIDAVECARTIQQEVFAYVRDNPDIPMSLRIGIEYGEGGIEDSEYYGPAFTAIEATCDAAGGGDIAVTALVKDQSGGADNTFVPLKPSPTAKSFVGGLFKLLWEPKRAMNVPPLEYRHIGAAPKPGEAE